MLVQLRLLVRVKADTPQSLEDPCVEVEENFQFSEKRGNISSGVYSSSSQSKQILFPPEQALLALKKI